MEVLAIAEQLRLLGQSYPNARIRLEFDAKAVIIKFNGKIEKFAYKKIKQTVNASGCTEFQSDGVKLVFAPSSRQAEIKLADAVSGKSVPVTPHEQPVSRPSSVHSSGMSSQARPVLSKQVPSAARQPVVAPAEPQKQKFVAPIKKKPVSTISASSDSPPVRAAPKPVLPSPAKPDPPKVVLELSKKPGEIDWYDDNEELSLSPKRAQSTSPDTFFPTTHTTQVASPIPQALRKYGTSKTAAGASDIARSLFPVSATKPSRVLDDRTPHDQMYASGRAVQPPAPPQSPPRSPPQASVTKRASYFMSALERLSASPRTHQSDTASSARTPVPLSLRQASSLPKPRFGLSSPDTSETMDLTVDGESASEIVLPKAPPSRPLTSWFNSTHSTSGAAAASSSSAAAPVRRNLPGGVRNLGNTCYIGATIQALCSVDLVRSRLSAPFWPSLITLQATEGAFPASAVAVEVNVVSDSLSSEEAYPTAAAGGSASLLAPVDAAELPGAGAEGAAAEDKPVVRDAQWARVQQKYGVHSVLSELCALVRLKAEFDAPAGTATTSTTSFASAGGWGGLVQGPRVLDVTRLKRAVFHHTKKYLGYSQQDAHEFLADLLHLLEEESAARWTALLEAWAALHASADGGGSEGMPVEGASSGNTIDADMSMKTDWESLLPVAECFRSLMRVQMRCVDCGYKHPAKHEPYEHFSLDLPGTSASTGGASLGLDSLLTDFFQEETRELTCPHCAGSSPSSATNPAQQSPDGIADTADFSASKRSRRAGQAAVSMALSAAPRVLVLQLKRFRYDPVLHDMVKVHAEVNFPLDLDLSAFVAPAGKEKGTAAPSSCAVGLGTEDLWASSAEDVLRSTIGPAQRLRGHVSAADVTPSAVGKGKYKLAAVIRHIGVSEASGHYICDIAKEAQGSVDSDESGLAQIRQWRRCDDSSVYAVNEEVVLRERANPYLLFYTAVQ